MAPPKKSYCKHSDPRCDRCQRARDAEKRYKECNREQVLRKAREHQRITYAADPDAKREIKRLSDERHREKRRAQNRVNYYARDPDERRAYYRKKFGGILDAERAPAVFAAQGCMCAICRRTEHGGKGWHADHSHATGLLRGVLCHFCNTGMGSLQDSVEILERAIAYLRNPPARR
jgi:hypothetical protein